MCKPDTWNSHRWIIEDTCASKDTAQTLIEHVVAPIKKSGVTVGHIEFAQNKDNKPGAKLLLNVAPAEYLHDKGLHECLAKFFAGQICRLLFWVTIGKASIYVSGSNGQYFVTLHSNEKNLFTSEYTLCNLKTLNVVNLYGFKISVIPVKENGQFTLKFVTVMPLFRYN